MNHYEMDELIPGVEAHFSVLLTQAVMDAFGGLSGDENPLHRDPAYAREAGFPSEVAYGMLVAAYYSTLAGVYLPGQRSLLQSVQLKFHRPAFVGDTLTVSGEVVEAYPELRMIVVRASIVNQRGEKVSSARLQVGVRSA